MALPLKVSTPPEKLPVMPFCVVKFSVSPVCNVPDEMVMVAPVRSVSLELTVRPESTTIAEPPTVKVFVVPEAATTGGAMTLTLSAAELLESEPSRATIASERVTGLSLVEEKVTDCKAV